VEFNKLKHKDSIMEYLVKFEKLKTHVLHSHPTLNESYFVSRFTNGLNDSLRLMVNMFYPTTVEQAA